MKIKNKITALLVALGLLASCHDDITPTYTVGEAVNAITLRAGISEGGEGVQTRAGAENHHNTPGHVNFTSGTQLRLRVDGTWHSATVTKTTTASTGAQTGADNKHNVVTFSKTSNPVEQLYWDDYGTADPDNTAGRTAGLTVYGVAVDGVDAAPAVSNWEALNWTVSTDQSTGNVWGKEDLLISNNIKDGKDGTYKFDDYVYDLKNDPDRSSNLLEFTHAMSKITVNLIAGDGFPTTGVGATTKKFAAEPEVVLTSNLYGQTSATEWAYTKGTVNVMTGVVSSPNTLATITTKTTDVTKNDITVVKEALVVPGSAFAENTQLLSILADGNRYYVNSEKMRTAIAAAITAGTHADSYTAQPGKNYVFKVIINKTGIDVTATIENWVDITAAPVTPIINFSQCYGETGTDFAKGFTLYRSKTVTGSYIDGLTEGNTSTVSYASAYTMSPQLYWPNHETHYFFRGVYPQVNTTNGPATGNVKANAVDIANVAYAQGKYPSDLMIGMPRKDDGTPDEHCKSTHDVDGICATDAAAGAAHSNEGLIHMNFQYAMSQVEVELQSEAGAAAVNIDENTVVELVNVYNSGEVAISDGTVSVSGDKGSYTLDKVAGENLKRHSAIVPQTLTFTEKGATTNLRFKITVTNNDAVLYTAEDPEVIAGTNNVGDVKTPATTDIYYADVEPILKSDKSGKVAPNGKWESGVHYKYVLKLSKTEVNVTATLTDWVEVEANSGVWF